jgi:hypothetical protein
MTLLIYCELVSNKTWGLGGERGHMNKGLESKLADSFERESTQALKYTFHIDKRQIGCSIMESTKYQARSCFSVICAYQWAKQKAAVGK